MNLINKHNLIGLDQLHKLSQKSKLFTQFQQASHNFILWNPAINLLSLCQLHTIQHHLTITQLALYLLSINSNMKPIAKLHIMKFIHSQFLTSL